MTESQVVAMERKQEDDIACSEIETAHPGYLGSQDPYYVGTFKGIGRVYQQTDVDTYCKVAQAKVYTTKTPITAAEWLNERVLPFYEAQELPVLRVLTDRGTAYCGKADRHDYQLYLALNALNTPKPRRAHPRRMGFVNAFTRQFCRRFIKSRCAKKSMTPWRHCRRIWTNGWTSTILSVRTKAKCAMEERQWRHSSTVKKSGRKSL